MLSHLKSLQMSLELGFTGGAVAMLSGSSCSWPLRKRSDLRLPGVDIPNKGLDKKPKNTSVENTDQPGIL